MSCNLDVVPNVVFCTFGPLAPVSGYCLFNTTGTSTILSVNHHSFPCLLRCWHMHKTGHHSLPPLGQGIEHVALPLLSARFELVGTWLYIATGTSTNLSLCCTCVTSTFFSTFRTYLCIFTEMSTNLSMHCSLMKLHGICGRL